MSQQYFDQKNIILSKWFFFIFLSQYCVQKCLVCILPNRDVWNIYFVIKRNSKCIRDRYNQFLILSSNPTFLLLFFNLLSISSTFYARLFANIFCAKILQSQNLTRENLLEALLYEKFERKMLMKLTPTFSWYKTTDITKGGEFNTYSLFLASNNELKTFFKNSWFAF